MSKKKTKNPKITKNFEYTDRKVSNKRHIVATLYFNEFNWKV